MVSTACGSSCTCPDGAQAPANGFAPAFVAVSPDAGERVAGVAPSAAPATGTGSSFTTSATAGSPARRCASPGETVAETASMIWKAFTFWAFVCDSSSSTGFWTAATALSRAVWSAAFSGVAATWFLNTTITLSVTFVDRAWASAADKGAPAPPAAAAGPPPIEPRAMRATTGNVAATVRSNRCVCTQAPFAVAPNGRRTGNRINTLCLTVPGRPLPGPTGDVGSLPRRPGPESLPVRRHRSRRSPVRGRRVL